MVTLGVSRNKGANNRSTYCAPKEVRAGMLRKTMEAVITRLGPEAEPRTCAVQGCNLPGTIQVVKLSDDGTPKELCFCENHGQEYAARGHLVISGDGPIEA